MAVTVHAATVGRRHVIHVAVMSGSADTSVTLGERKAKCSINLEFERLDPQAPEIRIGCERMASH